MPIIFTKNALFCLTVSTAFGLSAWQGTHIFADETQAQITTTRRVEIIQPQQQLPEQVAMPKTPPKAQLGAEEAESIARECAVALRR